MHKKFNLFFILFIVICISFVGSAEQEIYKPIITFDHSLSAMIFSIGDTSTMDSKFINGKLYVSDSVHNIRDLKISNFAMYRLKNYNGKEVMLYHVNDAGVHDSSRLVPIQSDGTWTYFYDVEFSEIIIDGFVGTWEVIAYNLSVSDSLNFGQEFNASNVTSLSINVTDDATKAHPYDINTTGLVGWWKLDDDYLDSSVNGNNGTAYGDTHYVNGKYNNGSSFDGDSDYILLGAPEILNLTDHFFISFNINACEWNSLNVFLTNNNNAFESIVFLNQNDNLIFRLQNSTNIIFDVNHPYSNTNELIHVAGELSGGVQKFYINNILVGINSFEGVLKKYNGWKIAADWSTREFNGTVDNLLIYNRDLSESERNNLYHNHLQQLQIKTNSNSTWSPVWNCTADNPIKVPYGSGELFNLLNFTVPDTVVQNGITIYDYPSTVQFDATATVGYTEDITKITESAAAGTYTLNITHAAGLNGTGAINYTTTNSVLLNADFWNVATLTTDNPNATLSTTLPHFNISTGYVIAGTEYYYFITQDYFYPPTNIQTTPSQTWINITWDAVPNADKYSVYELENGFPYVGIDPMMDGIKDAIYDYAHEFLIFSPNPISPGDYGTIYPVRTSLGAYLLIECVDNDDKLGDDDTIYYFDLDNDGLTVNDPAWKITNNGIKKYLWNGGSWQVTGVSNAVGASTGGGTHYPIHELFIPIAELGANWTNGSTVNVLVKREDSSLSPDVVTWYPYGNINDTDTSLWQEMVLNNPESYILLDNTTNLWYNATGLTPFTIYHGAVSAWNGSVESNYTLFDVITEDIPTYTVSGTVSDSDGDPIAGATVYSCNGFVHEITTTNESGYYIGYNFREGNYTICANKTGYAQNSIDIYVSTNLSNQNITLTRIPFTSWEIYLKLLELEEQNNEILLNMSINNTIVNDKIDTILIFILLNMAVIVGIIIGRRGKDNDN